MVLQRTSYSGCVRKVVTNPDALFATDPKLSIWKRDSLPEHTSADGILFDAKLSK
jgi:hypothetical protein